MKLIHSTALAFACLSSLVAASTGCIAAPGEGDQEPISQTSNALTVADLGGLSSCTISSPDYADCVVDYGYPVDASYTFTTKNDDGTAGPTLQAKAYVTGKNSVGMLVRLYGAHFDAIYSWKSGPAVVKSGFSSSISKYCVLARCTTSISTKEGPPPQRPQLTHRW